MKLKKLFSTVIVMVLLVCYVPALAFAEEYDLSQGSIEVSADESGQYVSQVDAGFVNVTQTSPTIISQSDSETPTQNTISISATGGATAEVTLDGVNIDASKTYDSAVKSSGDGTVIIELDGDNTLSSGMWRAGLEKEDDGQLIINDSNGIAGSLEAKSGNNGGGAGIGGGAGAGVSNITINGGTITAVGASNGAGIGSGSGAKADNITINGGKITAIGGSDAAGIGSSGGYWWEDISDCSNITINDGEIIAKGGQDAAGIGSGTRGSAKNITINGGKVDATGGIFGAGIGGGRLGQAENITITGGDISAKGGSSGAGIGGGERKDGTGIKITGGSVSATGGDSAAGIGGGGNSHYSGTSGDDQRGHGSDITISGDANVKVTNGEWGAYGSDPDNIFSNGACIGDGGTNGGASDGAEYEPDTSKLTPNGRIEYWHPGAKEYHRLITGTYVPPEPVLPVASAPEYSPLFRVVDANGADLGHSAVIENGVLTITAVHDFAVLTGALSGVDALMQQGVDTIVFITSGVGSAFELSALRAAGSASDIFRLTHDGEAATLTLGGEALDGVLK